MTLTGFALRLTVASGLLFAYYGCFLRNKSFHGYNRVYLLGLFPLAFLLALFSFPLPLPGGAGAHTLLPSTLSVIMEGGWEEAVTIYPGNRGLFGNLSVQQGLGMMYVAGVVISGLRLLLSLRYIRRLSAAAIPVTTGYSLLFYTAAPGTPFSFFNRIFWDPRLSPESPAGRQALAHELYHVRARHSADRLLMEMACCAGWFNPFFYLARKELSTLHEFTADAAAARLRGCPAYAELLLGFATGASSPRLTHPFFNNQLKRRITMLITPNRRYGYASRLLALPLLLLLTCAFSFRNGNLYPGKFHPGGRFTVVVDPGHGGRFPGATNQDGLLEKDINLAIALKIQAAAGRYGVSVVLTRNSDRGPGDAASLEADLRQRIDIARAAAPDLFISIHSNSDNLAITPKTGFDAYLSGKKNDQPAAFLAAALLNRLKTLYAVDDQIHASATGIAVLDKTTCPAVLLECGYLNNPADAHFISTAANQEKIAEKILAGIADYREQLTENKHPSLLLSAAAPRADTTPDPVQRPGKLFTKVEVEPTYPGGSDGWRQYLFKTLRYPQEAVDKAIKGTVLVQFIVDTAGTVSDVQVLSGPTLLREESIRVTKASGPWIPARQNGRTVHAYKRQPITYALERQS